MRGKLKQTGNHRMNLCLSFSKLRLVAFFITLLGGLLFLNQAAAFAEERVWTGGGDNNNFSTSGNWDPSGAPQSGDSLTIPLEAAFSSCTEVELNNDLDAQSVTLAGLTVTGSKPAECFEQIKLTGNDLALSGNIVGSSQEGLFQALYTDTNIIATATINIDKIYSTGSLAVGANSVTLRSSNFGGGISGTGSLTLSGFPVGGGGTGGGCDFGTATPRPFSGDSSGFSGSIIVAENGFITITSRATDVARHASSITQSGGGIAFLLDANQDMTFAKPITLNGPIYVRQARVNSNCDLPLAAKKLFLTNVVAQSGTRFALYDLSLADVEFTGSLSGAGNVTVEPGHPTDRYVKLPDGTILRSALKTTVVNQANKSTYCSPTYGLQWSVSQNNKWLINVDCRGTESSSTTIYGIVGGTGRLGSVVIENGGIIAPGESPGTLTVDNLEFEQGGIYEFEIAGSDCACKWDQIKVNGTVNLGNGTLKVIPLGGFTPTQGQSFTIIDNDDGTDPVQGTFAGLPEGATVEVNGVAWFTISYQGGDGNDVVLTVLPGVGDAGEANASQTGIVLVGLTLAGAAIVKGRGWVMGRIRG